MAQSIFDSSYHWQISDMEMTPELQQAMKEQQEILDAFIESGMDLDVKNSDGEIPSRD